MQCGRQEERSDRDQVQPALPCTYVRRCPLYTHRPVCRDQSSRLLCWAILPALSPSAGLQLAAAPEAAVAQSETATFTIAASPVHPRTKHMTSRETSNTGSTFSGGGWAWSAARTWCACLTLHTLALYS
ncbi:hypothetical protein AcW1_002280 [Taiwanofungus camphoratus]|nr:hypothetical protein AcV5_010282 [Antrodia cinnamomea]KAI0944611.1 hypothetical protein AcW1_002280 [Antrodia cinnamomea]